MELHQHFFTQGVKNIVTGHTFQQQNGEGCDGFFFSTYLAWEMLYVLDGNSRYMLGKRVYDALPGTFFLIDHWEPHAFGYRKKDHDLLHLWLNFNEHEPAVNGNILTVSQGGEFKSLTHRLRLPGEYFTLLNRRWNSLNETENITPEKIVDFLKVPLEAVLDEVSFMLFHAGSSPAESEGADSVVEAVKRYIRMSNGRDCSLSRLEKISGYSKYYLAHRFVRYEGCTIGTYIDKIRVQYTKEALKRGLRQKEIAYELGFSTPSNFWNWLQKHRDGISAAPDLRNW